LRRHSCSAVAGFGSILIARMDGIIDRISSLNTIADDDTSRVHLRADIPRLKKPRAAHE
jgi:hypothetical protein